MKFVVTCGGTAGHINPGLAVAGKLMEMRPGSEVLFIGSNGNMEMNLVPRDGYEIKGIDITGISRGHDLEALRHNIETVNNVVHSVHEAKRILREFSPDAVIGTGGYVCFPVLKAAASLHIPTAVHESNAVPGLTTKLLSGSVDIVMVGYADSAAYYSHPERVHVTGTPVRAGFNQYSKTEAKEKLGLSPDAPLVVSVMGSLGAGFVNSLIPEMLPAMCDSGITFIHSAGKIYYKDLIAKADECRPGWEKCGVSIYEYIYDMPLVLTAADLVVCRAGASTLAELGYMGKPAVIIPSPNVVNNHQEKNARLVEKSGGAVVMLESGLTAQLLFGTVCDIVGDSARLAAMENAMSALSVRDSADMIAELVLKTVEKK